MCELVVLGIPESTLPCPKFPDENPFSRDTLLYFYYTCVYNYTNMPEVQCNIVAEYCVDVYDPLRIEICKKINSIMIFCVLQLPNGYIAGGMYNGDIYIWNVLNCQRLNIYKGHVAPIHDITIISPYELMASGSRDYTIRIWNYQSGECVKILKGFDKYIFHVINVPSRPSLLVSVTEHFNITVWNWEYDLSLWHINYNLFNYAIQVINISNISITIPDENKISSSNSQTLSKYDDYLAIGVGDGQIMVYNFDGQNEYTYFCPDNDGLKALIQINKSLIACSSSKTISLINIEKNPWQFVNHFALYGASYLINIDSYLISTSYHPHLDRIILEFWDIDNQKCVAQISGFEAGHGISNLTNRWIACVGFYKRSFKHITKEEGKIIH